MGFCAPVSRRVCLFVGNCYSFSTGTLKIVLSVRSVTLVSVPGAPSRVSLALSLSRELSASLLSCPHKESTSLLPVTVSATPVSSRQSCPASQDDRSGQHNRLF
jgi:hypothetical protein